MDLIGKVLGNRYELIEKIGVGGMATVYKAKCRLLNRNVAIKILKDEFANDAEFIKRFQVEAQSAASLSHPNIVSIYDVGNEDGLHYIVMELIEGKTLKEIIDEKGRLPWRDAANIASQIASALAKAHNNHIIHRDIKPHNIIITKEGVAKVTDFGIAKAVSNSTINAFGSTIGSVHYFSPEHARGGYTDEKSDIYSLGVVLYEMVTGRLPFDGDTPVSIALKHLQETPVEPAQINPNLPLGINNIILKAMAKEISQRYKNATEMCKDLDKILKQPENISNAVVTLRAGGEEFPTQKIPIVGVNNNARETNDVARESEVREVKKKVTKKQALTRLILVIVAAVVLFFGAFKLGTFVLSELFGGKTVEVPKVVGMIEEEAKATLEKQGLLMKVKGKVESDYPAGFVAEQQYDEHYRLKEGATVEVAISKGGKQVMVPNITNTSVEAAKIQIEQRGLVFAVEEIFSDDTPSGDVVSQKPEVNEEVPVGSTVTLYISKGSESGLVKVPDVMNKSAEIASDMLSNKNLVAEITYIKDTNRPNDIVVSQTPEKDTMVSELSTIVLVVNKTQETSGSKPDDRPQTPSELGKKTISIDLSNKGERETFKVKVTLQGASVGTRVEYEGVHSRADGKINIDITNAPGAYLKLYIDDKLDSEQVL